MALYLSRVGSSMFYSKISEDYCHLLELCRFGVALPRVNGDHLVGGVGDLERHHGDAAWRRLRFIVLLLNEKYIKI